MRRGLLSDRYRPVLYRRIVRAMKHGFNINHRHGKRSVTNIWPALRGLYRYAVKLMLKTIYWSHSPAMKLLTVPPKVKLTFHYENKDDMTNHITVGR